MAVRSDWLLAADWRVTLLEDAACLSVEDRVWLRYLSRQAVACGELEPGWEFAWTTLGQRARRVLVRHWYRTV